MFGKSFRLIFGIGAGVIATLTLAAAVVGGVWFWIDAAQNPRQRLDAQITSLQVSCHHFLTEFKARLDGSAPVAPATTDLLKSIDVDDGPARRVRELAFRVEIRNSPAIARMVESCEALDPISAAERYVEDVRSKNR